MSRSCATPTCPPCRTGPPGTGETSPVRAAFPDVLTIVGVGDGDGDGDTTVADYTGEDAQQPDGIYEFIYGPLTRAMTEGRVLFIDDATLISPAVRASPHKGETIAGADGF